MSAEFHQKKSINTVNNFKFLLILTVSAAVLGLGKSGALATVSNISETQPCLQLHRVRVASKGRSQFKQLERYIKTRQCHLSRSR